MAIYYYIIRDISYKEWRDAGGSRLGPVFAIFYYRRPVRLPQ
jgi:hypothetical protein